MPIVRGSVRMDTVRWLLVQDSIELKKRKDGAAVALVQKLALQHGPTRRPGSQAATLASWALEAVALASQHQLGVRPAQRLSWPPAARGAL